MVGYTIAKYFLLKWKILLELDMSKWTVWRLHQQSVYKTIVVQKKSQCLLLKRKSNVDGRPFWTFSLTAQIIGLSMKSVHHVWERFPYEKYIIIKKQVKMLWFRTCDKLSMKTYLRVCLRIRMRLHASQGTVWRLWSKLQQ